MVDDALTQTSTPSRAEPFDTRQSARPRVRPAQTRGLPAEPKDWDLLTSSQRLEHLEQRFTAAVLALEAGPQRREDESIAGDALTAMRAELYASESGRARYRGYEDRLDRALGEAQEGAAQ